MLIHIIALHCITPTIIHTSRPYIVRPLTTDNGWKAEAEGWKPIIIIQLLVVCLLWEEHPIHYYYSIPFSMTLTTHSLLDSLRGLIISSCKSVHANCECECKNLKKTKLLLRYALRRSLATSWYYCLFISSGSICIAERRAVLRSLV